MSNAGREWRRSCPRQIVEKLNWNVQKTESMRKWHRWEQAMEEQENEDDVAEMFGDFEYTELVDGPEESREDASHPAEDGR